MHAILRLLLLTALGLSPLVSSAAGQADDRAIPESDSEAHPGAEPAATAPAFFTGRVLEPDGAPAAGAVVVSSAGGQCVTAADGTFELEVRLPLGAQSLQVSAIANVGGSGSVMASALVSPLAPCGTTPVDRLVLASSSSCQPGWLPAFGPQPGVSPFVVDLAVYDDGNGPGLYVGGTFNSAGGVAANHIARWDGTSWSLLGSGTNGSVRALTVYDDGSGQALYVGGTFTSAGGVAANGIARWDGTSWSALGSGISGSFEDVLALTVYDDGSGPALYAGGDFTSAGGMAANQIAKWDGASWSALGSGTDNSVRALKAYDDGSGPALYVGGRFLSAGGVAANRIAKWNGTSWSALGAGVSAPGAPEVEALAVFDDGSGPALYVGGTFTSAGGGAANRIAKWDGASWSALGSGTDSGVYALTVCDDGSGPALYVGGAFTSAGGSAANEIARWDGTTWSALGSGTSSGGPISAIDALAVYDDGSGPTLFVGGDFTSAGGLAANRIAKWNGTSWSVLGKGFNRTVQALTVYDDGSGPALYAAGEFTSAGGVAANRIAKWDGTSWSALGSGVAGVIVNALAVYDDGSGPGLYAGGAFMSAGGVATNRIAKWDGASWSALGSGTSSAVGALAAYDDGSGPALYVGGNFTSAGGVAANRIAKWDGTSWSALGSGTDGTVRALTVFDDGSGGALYAAGAFTSAGGVAASRIAKWDGTTWSAVGGGTNGAGNNALTVYDDGSGSALYVAGTFSTAGGVPANEIAKWDGTNWSALGSGLGGSPFPTALTVHDDGSGPALYVGGSFTSAGGVATNNIARWDGTSWSALGSGISGALRALTMYEAGGGPALYVGGDFAAGPAGDSFLAKWACPPAILSLPGCAGNPAALAALATSAPLGAPFPVLITGSAAASGLGLLYFGAPGFDGSGCGTVLPGLGELLLALTPTPIAIASGVLASGTCALAPTVPDFPALRGFKVHLQGVAVQLVAPVLVEPTNALAVTLGP